MDNLEVVAWRISWIGLTGKRCFESFTDRKAAEAATFEGCAVEPEPLTPLAPAQEEIERLRARVLELERAKWDVKHVDTMNDMVAMGMARDDAEARALAAEAQVDRMREALREIAAMAGESDPHGPEEYWGRQEGKNEAAEIALAALQEPRS